MSCPRRRGDNWTGHPARERGRRHWRTSGQVTGTGDRSPSKPVTDGKAAGRSQTSHAELRERLHHLTHQIAIVRLEVLAQPVERVKCVRDHRISSQFVLVDLLRLMRWSSRVVDPQPITGSRRAVVVNHSAGRNRSDRAGPPCSVLASLDLLERWRRSRTVRRRRALPARVRRARA